MWNVLRSKDGSEWMNLDATPRRPDPNNGESLYNIFSTDSIEGSNASRNFSWEFPNPVSLLWSGLREFTDFAQSRINGPIHDLQAYISKIDFSLPVQPLEPQFLLLNIQPRKRQDELEEHIRFLKKKTDDGFRSEFLSADAHEKRTLAVAKTRSEIIKNPMILEIPKIYHDIRMPIFRVLHLARILEDFSNQKISSEDLSTRMKTLGFDMKDVDVETPSTINLAIERAAANEAVQIESILTRVKKKEIRGNFRHLNNPIIRDLNRRLWKTLTETDWRPFEGDPSKIEIPKTSIEELNRQALECHEYVTRLSGH